MRISRNPIEPFEQPSPPSDGAHEPSFDIARGSFFQRVNEFSGKRNYPSFREFANDALSLGCQNVSKEKSPVQKEAIKDAYWAVYKSGDAENAYQRGRSGGNLVGEASPVVSDIERTIQENVTPHFAYRPFIYEMALNPRRGGYERTSHWRSISASLEAAHIPSSVKGLLYLDTLQSICRRRAYDILVELTDPQNRFPIPDGEELMFWKKYLVGQSRKGDGIKFYLGYIDGVSPVIREKAEEFFGTEWTDALKIWSTLYYMKTSQTKLSGSTLTAMRVPCLEALGCGNVAAARDELRSLILGNPESFSDIIKKDFDITEKSILEYRIAQADEWHRKRAAKRKERFASDEEMSQAVLGGVRKGKETQMQRAQERKKEALEVRKKNLLSMKKEIERNNSYISHLLVGAFLPESTSYPRLYYIEKQTEEKGNPAYADISYTDIDSNGLFHKRALPVPLVTVREYDFVRKDAKHTRTNTSTSAQKIQEAISDGKCIDLGIWDAGDFTENLARGIVEKLPTDIFDQWRKIKDRYR